VVFQQALYTDLNDLPRDIDAACVVVKSSVLGGKGTDLAIGLMNKGIHVLLEQPVHHNDLSEMELGWKKAKELWNYRLGSPLVSDYFHQNGKALRELLLGEVSATMLLFPEGKNDVANALYRETIIAGYLNGKIGEWVLEKCKNSEELISVLEVGAGTGATADVVLRTIEGALGQDAKIKYEYTDISNYFLRDAQSRYENISWMRTRILDIEKDIEIQGIIGNSIDLIIAAGVINNVRNTVEVLKNLKRALKPGGIMLISEADGESIQMLISQVFMMHEADDNRKDSSTTFLNNAQWLEAFHSAGLTVFDIMPQDTNKLSVLGQKLFVVSK